MMAKGMGIKNYKRLQRYAKRNLAMADRVGSLQSRRLKEEGGKRKSVFRRVRSGVEVRVVD